MHHFSLGNYIFQQKIDQYKNTKKEVDTIIKDINLEYKSIKKEIYDFLEN